MRTTPLKVFQFATGNVGSEMVHKTVQHPDLELIGLYCYSEDKVGRDAGEIVGIDPIGVLATNSVEDVIAAKPDCVTYFGVWPDIDLFCRLLESGINVVTTSDWITGHSRNQHHPHPSGRKPTELVDEAGKRGNATLYGTGMNPGLAQILAIVNTAGLSRIDHIQVIETVDVSCHHSVDTWKKHGYGRPVDDPEVPQMLEAGATVFADSIYMIADCCGIEIDEIAFECELGACKEEVDLGWWRLPKGSVGASLAKYIGKAKGEPKIEVHLEWQMTPNTEPKWNVQNCYIMTIRGNPQIMNRHMILPAMDSGQMDWSDP
ncbi:MAG: dihydrodipicolinate reductase, partial [Deltaproteobacteria bacterium]|nr:dihydrodipicolinate reductase [Deltaproteobacteria bacterium]